jgi:hypothetical protein
MGLRRRGVAGGGLGVIALAIMQRGRDKGRFGVDFEALSLPAEDRQGNRGKIGLASYRQQRPILPNAAARAGW